MLTTVVAAITALVPVLLAVIALWQSKQATENQTNKDAGETAALRLADVQTTHALENAERMASGATAAADQRVQQFYVD